MSFLTPAALAIAAAVTVPPLVLLYFLKLRRRDMPVSSTFFWKQAVQDLQVNAPFQRLRKNLLLFLQILVLALCACALGQPLLRQEASEERSVVLLIDRSASMNVVEPDGKSRLQRAKAEALELVEGMQESDRGMVIAFNDRAQVVTPFTRNRALLREGITGIAPSQGLSRLREGIALAEAHAETQIVPSRGGMDTPIINDIPVQLVLFSDGRLEDAGEVSVERMALQLVNVAISDDNVGIVSLQADREYERPEVLSVVAVVQNFGPQAVEVDVELFIAGDHMDIQTIELGPGIAPLDDSDFDPARATRPLTFPAGGGEELVYAGSGVIEVALRRKDALGADNRAFAIIPPPRALAVLLVSDGNLWLKKLLQHLPFEVAVMSTAAYEAASEDELTEGGRSRYDVVVFDDHDSGRVPLGSYLFLGGMPDLPGFVGGPVHQVDSVFDWDDRHAVMRYVSPQNITILQWREMELPSNAVTLMEATEGPVLAAVNHQGSRFLICAFAVLNESRDSFNSTWPYRQHFVVFMMNALQYLAGQLDPGIQASLRPGDALQIEVPENTQRVRLSRPDGSTDTVTVGSLTTAHYGKTDRVGVYTARPTAEGSTSFAVNLFSRVEGWIQPNSALVIGGSGVESRQNVRLTNLSLWPFLVAGALAFVLLEWAVYSRRILI